MPARAGFAANAGKLSIGTVQKCREQPQPPPPNFKLSFTDAEADALKGGLADDMKSPSPIVPSGCGAMMRISEQDDVIFLEKALP